MPDDTMETEAGPPRYQYDQEDWERTLMEIAEAQIDSEIAGHATELKPDIRIDAQGILHIEDATFQNISPEARKRRVLALFEALRRLVLDIISKANRLPRRRSASAAPEPPPPTDADAPLDERH